MLQIFLLLIVSLLSSNGYSDTHDSVFGKSNREIISEPRLPDPISQELIDTIKKLRNLEREERVLARESSKLYFRKDGSYQRALTKRQEVEQQILQTLNTIKKELDSAEKEILEVECDTFPHSTSDSPRLNQMPATQKLLLPKNYFKLMASTGLSDSEIGVHSLACSTGKDPFLHPCKDLPQLYSRPYQILSSVRVVCELAVAKLWTNSFFGPAGSHCACKIKNQSGSILKEMTHRHYAANATSQPLRKTMMGIEK